MESVTFHGARTNRADAKYREAVPASTLEKYQGSYFPGGRAPKADFTVYLLFPDNLTSAPECNPRLSGVRGPKAKTRRDPVWRSRAEL
jgi:hypothetical protein